jgi:hypothetical protein
MHVTGAQLFGSDSRSRSFLEVSQPVADFFTSLFGFYEFQRDSACSLTFHLASCC